MWPESNDKMKWDIGYFKSLPPKQTELFISSYITEICGHILNHEVHPEEDAASLETLSTNLTRKKIHYIPSVLSSW